MGFALPARFHDTPQYKALKDNANILTTPFDIHATLRSVLKWPTEEEAKKEQDLKSRELTLFRPILHKRGCADAQVKKEPFYITLLLPITCLLLLSDREPLVHLCQLVKS